MKLYLTIVPKDGTARVEQVTEEDDLLTLMADAEHAYAHITRAKADAKVKLINAIRG